MKITFRASLNWSQIVTKGTLYTRDAKSPFMVEVIIDQTDGYEQSKDVVGGPFNPM
jgi:hypothetical protein